MSAVYEIKSYFRGLPARYVLTGVAAGVLLYLAARATPWSPFGTTGNYEAVEFTGALVGVVSLGLLAAPLVSLRRPGAAALVVLAPLPIGVISEHEWPFTVVAGLLVVVVLGAWASPRQAAVIAVVALLPVATMAAGWSAMVVPFGAVIDVRSLGDGVGILAMYAVVAAALFGSAMWIRAVVLRDGERLELDHRARLIEDEGAVLAERARLARDLHDVVAHHVSLIAVRAETATYTDPELGEPARRVLAEIAAEARLALDELRGVLGILGRADEADRAPQPTLSDIAALVERTRRSGQEVHLEGDVGGPVGSAAGYAAYRVVQEALTNARKHAPETAVDVAVVTTPQLVELRVANALAAASRGIDGGRGLVGMRERVESLGGRLRVQAGGGRFEIVAVIPSGAAS